MSPGIVAETDLAGTLKSEYIFFDGERVARRDGATGTGGVFYYFSDHLKTASIITDSAGTIKAESDYYPWGGELQFVANDSNHYKFASKERDGETGLDYFGARYYSNGLGRWVSADWSNMPVPVPYAVLGNPQTLNLYGYSNNNPTTFADSDGHYFYDGPSSIPGSPESPTKCRLCAEDKKDDKKKNEDNHREDAFGRAVAKEGINVLIDSYNFGNWIACLADSKCKSPRHLSPMQPSDEDEQQYMQQLAIVMLFAPGGEGEGGAEGAAEVHHLLPREFQQIFKELGFDIEKYTINVGKQEHRLRPNGLHTNGGGNWNKVWRQFMRNKNNRTPERVLDQLFKMLRDFNIHGTM